MTMLAAVVGGLYFGLFSCGGYVSHRQIFDLLFGAVVLAMVALPPRRLRRIHARLLLGGGAIATFVLSSAVASALYPAPPVSFGEFLHLTWVGLRDGPC
jgi:hypothetical protein